MKFIVKVLFILGFLLFGIGKVSFDVHTFFHSLLSIAGILLLFLAVLLLIWNKASKL